MKARMGAVLLFSLLVLLLAGVGRGTGETFEWVTSLTEGFISAKEKNRLLLVFASAEAGDAVVESCTKKMEFEGWSELGRFFVGLKLSGKDAKNFADANGVAQLPVVAVLLNNGKLVMFTETSEGFADLVVDSIVKVSAAPDLSQVYALLQGAAERIETSGVDLVLAIQQQLAIKGLDDMIEKAKQGSSQQGQQPQPPRFDPNETAQSSEAEGGQPGEGSVTGENPEDFTAGSGSQSDTARWGKLPPKLREDASSARTEEIPPSYRRLVEEYFRSLMSE